MRPSNPSAPGSVAILAGIALTLSACGPATPEPGDQQDNAAAPTYPGEGASGLVDIEKAPIDEAPEQTVSGGQNQTPVYGEPGGVPSEVRSGPVFPAGVTGSSRP